MTQTNDSKKNYYMIMLFVTAAFFFALHMTFVGFTNDEQYFLEYKKGFSSLFDIIIDRYKTDSSRVISEYLLFFLLGKPFIFWQVLDTLIVLLTYHSLSVILVNDKYSRYNTMVFMAIAAYPFMHVGSAGWICTSLNYLWPLATMVYALSIAVRRYRGQEVKFWQYLLAGLALVFTANTEMSAAALAIIFVFVLILRIKAGKAWIYEILGLLSQIGGMIFALTAPGNGERTAMEALNWMPEFPNLTFFEKLRLCSVFVFEHFVAIPDIIFILFGIVIAVYGVKKSNRWYKNLIALLPIVITAIYTLAYLYKYAMNVLEKYNSGQGIQIYYDFTTPTIYPKESFDIFLQYAEFISLYVYVAAVVASIAWIIKDINKTWSCIVSLGAGFAVRMALLLSPTMFVSWHRTLIYIYFAFIYTIIVIVLEGDITSGTMPATASSETAVSTKSNKWTKGLVYGILVVGILVNIVLTVGLQIRKG